MTERRHPRTIQEAFGPYASSNIETQRPRDSLAVRCFYWVMATLAVGCLLVQLTGCSGSMTNDQVIAEVKKCHDAGMDARAYSNIVTEPEASHVVCRPKVEK